MTCHNQLELYRYLYTQMSEVLKLHTPQECRVLNEVLYEILNEVFNKVLNEVLTDVLNKFCFSFIKVLNLFLNNVFFNFK